MFRPCSGYFASGDKPAPAHASQPAKTHTFRMYKIQPISFFKLQTGATLQSQARNKPKATGQRIDFGLSSCLLNLMLISNYTCSRSAKNLVLLKNSSNLTS
jgi:hypothetical protein